MTVAGRPATPPTAPAAVLAPPPLDPDFTVRALALALSQVLDDSKRSGFVVGLSGGIDSALAASIAARAVGPHAVRAFFLPAPTTPAESGVAAASVADHLGIGLVTLPVAPLVAAASLPPDNDERALRSRRGNLLARLRMALLYDRAAAHDALVLGTGNKSEIVLGYTTLWGDMAADCWPLGDLYKSQVSAIARASGIPAAVSDRAPSAELWEGQTDEDDMGFSYSLADRVLYYFIDERYHPDEIAATGVPRPLVDRILERVRTHAFKRRLPQVPKLSARTVGHDFHHPRAWRGPA
ncbi:MAG TPA: NAD+ synthase [Gemmatimonadota bacterium]|nr:NAD+ synthase [Gemmatimonadota bacterium]